MSERALVLVTTSFPISGDGSEAAGSFVSDLAEELAKSVPVRVVAPGHSAAREQWSPGVEVFRYAAPSKPLSTLKPWQIREIVRVLRGGARATREAVNAGPTAHMLALWALPSGEWARRTSRATGVPYSVWTLGSDIWTLGRIPLIRNLLRRVLQQAHARYSDGLKLADDTRRIAGREVEFLASTRRIDSRRERPLADAPPYRLLFLGRWHPNKGVDLLLDALDLLEDADWSRIAGVEIQGGGPLETLVRERVAALQARGRPVEAGHFLAKQEAEAAILRADFLLIPSRIESIPLVFSDAMKLDCPVVCMPTGDLPALIANEPRCGVIASNISSAAFAVALSNALREAPATFSSGMIARAGQFGLDNVACRVLSAMDASSHA
ncbi:MAG: glycosyltransferase [Gallionella sp.]